jgi:hypothetical protein
MILVGYIEHGEIVITDEYEGHPEANARMLELSQSHVRVVKCKHQKNGGLRILGIIEG